MELKKRSVAYIVSNFPCYSETFILSELVQLRRMDVEVIIFSLRAAREKLLQEDVKALLSFTFYSPFLFSFRLISANLYYLCVRPGVYLRLLQEIIWGFLPSPVILLKNLAIWPKSIHFAYFIRKEGISHIHAHFANYPATAAMIVSRLLGIPFTFTSHAHDLYFDHKMVGRKTKMARRTFTISHYNKRYILERFPSLSPEKIEVLGASIETRVFTPLREKKGEGPLRIVAVGRLLPKKGFRYLIDACQYLLSAHIRFRCQIVGEGPQEGALRKLIHRLDLKDCVTMEGPLMREGVLDILREADVFVCPSVVSSDIEIQDGIPVTLMEAMSMEIPVVATRVSGIPEMVIDKETGLLVEPGDPGALAEAIIRLSRHSHLRSKLGRCGREKVLQEHDVRKNVDRLIKVFFD